MFPAFSHFKVPKVHVYFCYQMETWPEWVRLGPAVVCGFLTLCRKDSTTWVQVATRVHLLKLETVKQGRAQHRGSNRGAQAGLPWLTGKPEKRGPWGQVQGISPGQAATAHCSPGCKSPEDSYSLGDAYLWGKENGQGMDQAAPQRERTLGPLSWGF